MKRKITLNTFAALIVSLVFLTSAQAQNQVRAVADTGIITIGPNQILRISGDGVDQDDPIAFSVQANRISGGLRSAGHNEVHGEL
jgi:hypothetical protein